MHDARSLREYRRRMRQALENKFLGQAMDNFAVAYRASRARAFSGVDVEQLVSRIASIKDQASAQLDKLLETFRDKATAAGATVHLAADASEANRIIARVAAENRVKRIIKSKSMTAEETLLNHFLETEGFEVTETDLGEWIIQLRKEGPSHMVMPAIHLSRFQVGDLFTRVTGTVQDAENIDSLVKVARRKLRRAFIEADMGISGANFAIAESGTLGIITNEGNGRLVTTLPRIHLALVGLDKLLPNLEAALVINQVLPRNATGQAITSYVTWITGPTPKAGDGTADKQLHIVFLDNGRRKLAADPLWRQVLRCVRCGACANVCPVYRMVGGHQFGHIYIGAIGLINTYFFHGRDKARNLVQNCLNCGACKQVCAADIDLPRLIKEVHQSIQKEEGLNIPTRLLGQVLRNRNLFHKLLRTARLVQKPATDKQAYLRHLPMLFSRQHGYRRLPAIADQSFREKWPKMEKRFKRSTRHPVRDKDTHRPQKVALFAGCLQDFVYPEQLEATVDLMADRGVKVAFPMEQSCCGLPLSMMGEKQAAIDVARQNIEAFAQLDEYHIITLCASCAAHLKNAYPTLLSNRGAWDARARAFSARVMPFSVFVNDYLHIESALTTGSLPKATYHAPCHLCRGLKVQNQPRALVEKAGFNFIPAAEEETCCGFGGTYSGKFPEISSRIVNRKIADILNTGAQTVLTECPGCIVQLRGALAQRKLPIKVLHFSEALAKIAGKK